MIVYRTAFALITLCLPLFASTDPIPKSDAEALAMRRVAFFWQEKNLGAFQEQALKFIEQYPDSFYLDHLYVLLGQSQMQDHQWQAALSYFRNIRDKDLRASVHNDELRCLYEVGDFETLSVEAALALPSKDLDIHNSSHAQVLFYYAQASFQLHLENDNKEELLNTQSYFEALLLTEYRQQAQFALAELARRQSDHRKAADLFISLSEQGIQQELCLLEAARSQKEFDSQLALNTLKRAKALKGPYRTEVVLLQLQLHYELGKYAAILRSQKTFYEQISNEQKYKVFYWAAKSLIALEKFDVALKYMDQFFLKAPESDPILKNALLSSIAAAQELGQDKRAKGYLRHLQRLHPDSPELAQALYLQALFLSRNHQFQGAIKELDELLAAHPEQVEADSLFFQKHLIYRQSKQFHLAREVSLEFLEKFPDSHLRQEVLIEQVHSSSEALQQVLNHSEIDADDIHSAREVLIEDLNYLIKDKAVFKKQQHFPYSLQKVATLIDLDRVNEAVSYLDELQNSFVPQEFSSKLSFLSALAQLRLGKLKQFTEEAEALLSTDPEYDRANLRLELVRSYQSLAEESSIQVEQEEYRQACITHLDHLAEKDPDSLTTHLRLWLAKQHYAAVPGDHLWVFLDRSVDLGSPQLIEHSIRSLKHLLYSKTDSLIVYRDGLLLDEEALCLARLLHLRGNTDESITLLKELQLLYQNQAQLKWRFTHELQYLLARHYADTEKWKLSLSYLNKLLNKKNFINPDLFLYVQLNHAVLNLKHRKLEKNQELKAINCLDQLRRKRQFTSEPVHLLAGIYYAQNRAKQSEKSNYHQSLLDEMRINRKLFTAKSDIQSQEYHAVRELYPKLDELYRICLLFMDGQIAYAQAQNAQEKGERQEARDKMKLASTIFRNLLNEKFAIPKYLSDQAEFVLENLTMNQFSALSEDKALRSSETSTEAHPL